MSKHTAEIWHVVTDKFAEAQIADIRGEFTLQFPADYTYVATIEARDYEDAYRLSNNIDSNWHEPPCRSTSVGDVVVINGVAKRVASLGFADLV